MISRILRVDIHYVWYSTERFIVKPDERDSNPQVPSL